MNRNKTMLVHGALILGVLLFIFLKSNPVAFDENAKSIDQWRTETKQIFLEHSKKNDFIDNEASLKGLLPFDWDQALVVNGGYTSIADVMKHGIKSNIIPADAENYKIYNDYFGDDEDGLVIINSQNRIVFGINMNVPIRATKQSYAISADEICLKGKIGPQNNYYFLIKKCGEDE